MEQEKERPLRGNHGTGRTTEKEKEQETTKERITKEKEKEKAGRLLRVERKR